MLKRLKIGGRVNVLIALPVLAMIVFAAVAYTALERASVRGDEYKALKLAQDLRAEVRPPSANLLEAWSVVNHIGVLVAAPTTAGEDRAAELRFNIGKVRASEAEFERSVTYWSQQELDLSMSSSFMVDGVDAAREFFDIFEAEMVPAVEDDNVSAVLASVRSLQTAYDAQQEAVTQTVRLSELEVAAREIKTDDFVGDVIVIAGLALLALLVLTLLLAVLVRRSIVRPIRALASKAKKVAAEDLPGAVHEIQNLPADAEPPRLESLTMKGRDEVAELSKSFNSVQDAALELAAEQAVARRVVSDNLVNIARRNQSLLGRTLGFITTLEDGERDPEALDNLFRIDHLTTRMRRNAQSLLVLAGAEPTRVRSAAVPVGDVVRAALSEVENYTQVELADLGEANVQGGLVPEVAHLLAELLENATSFSPPTNQVTVVGRAVPEGHQLAIVDYGIGMSDADLLEANRRLNSVSSFDRETNRMLGFQVVARLAARHGIRVMLSSTPGGTGVTAIVRLPKSVLDVAGETFTPLAGEVPTGPQLAAQPTDWWSKQAQASPYEPAAAAATAVVERETLSNDQMWAMLEDDGTPVADPTNELIVPSLPESNSGLVKRVRGAQMPDLGAAPVSESGWERPPEEVRDTLTNLQRGTDLGRQQGTRD